MSNVLNNQVKVSKTAVKQYWEENTCDAQFGAGADNLRMYFDDNEHIRYEEMPEIFAFAQFTRYHGQKVLEVGTGMGADFIQWVRSGAVAFGVDLTEAGLSWTKKRLKCYGLSAASLQTADAENLPFADSSFDLVYSFGVIHHSPNTPEALGELLRVCRPGGSVKIMIYNKYSAIAVMYWIRYALLRGRPFQSLSTIFSNHIESPGTKLYSMGEARDLVRRAGGTLLTLRCHIPYFSRLRLYHPLLRPIIRLAGRVIVFLMGGVDRAGYFMTMEIRKPA